MVPYFCLLLCWLTPPLRGDLEILNPEEVDYVQSNVTATVGGSVTLSCGSAVPSIFIWGFTKPGSDNSVAVAYDYGHGPRLEPQSGGLGRMEIPDNTSALVIEGLHRNSTGTYTCQAMYDVDNSTRITFYSTRLDVEDER